MKMIIFLVIVFQGTFGGGNTCCNKIKAEEVGKNKKQSPAAFTPEASLEILFEDDDALLLLDNSQLILKINSKPPLMNSKLLSTNFSSQALSLWKDPIHLQRGLQIIQDMLTDKQYYKDLWNQFFTNTPLTAVKAGHYAVGMIRFQKPKLYKILVQIIAEFKKWKPLSPVNADFVLFETNENKLVLERSRLLEKADFLVNDPEPIERWIRLSLNSTFQNYENAAMYTMRRRDELPEEDELHKALVDSLRDKLEGNVAIFEERKAARCAICLDEMQEMKVLKCGHMFCKNGIKTWMEQEKTCPICRAKVSRDDLKEENQREFRKSMWQKKETAKNLKY